MDLNKIMIDKTQEHFSTTSYREQRQNGKSLGQVITCPKLVNIVVF
jgi:hypothetical protein